MRHHWLGLHNNNSGTLGSEGCGELLGELFGGVCMHRRHPNPVAMETISRPGRSMPGTPGVFSNSANALRMEYGTELLQITSDQASPEPHLSGEDPG